jgi:hypothetical protein
VHVPQCIQESTSSPEAFNTFSSFRSYRFTVGFDINSHVLEKVSTERRGRNEILYLKG